MALLIKDPADLVKYLETRLNMAEGQLRSIQALVDAGTHGKQSPGLSNARGIVYAFQESLAAARALVAGVPLETAGDLARRLQADPDPRGAGAVPPAPGPGKPTKKSGS